MIGNGVVHCLNALGIVAKEQRFNEFMMKKNTYCFPFNLLILILIYCGFLDALHLSSTLNFEP